MATLEKVIVDKHGVSHRVPLTPVEVAEHDRRAEEYRLNNADPLRRYLTKAHITDQQKLELMERNLGWDRGARLARKGHPLADRIEAFAETVRGKRRG